ncbi:prion-like-(Q/N-rich) domain-bearing protein 25 [Colletes gigas]|uniref:prion-like-(Q/N-rich) domain-bearing protein 25 n=1 Tax=Colletes gigas TaxID=935657 RepID=UPI001C9ADFDD|nr:prion-like-(Q/N-rich) domain-bearing protein 25 [Colletes gigas]
MNQILKIGVLFATLGSLSCTNDITQQYGTAKYGEGCIRDRNCIPHAFCKAQMTCICEQYYSPTPDKTMCIASEGLFCTEDSTCRSMTNAECKQGKCACKDSYVLDTTNSSNCINRPSMVGDRCQRIDDCQDVLGRAMCINEICQCVSGYHFVNHTGKCIQTRFLYNTCTKDYECMGLGKEDILICKGSQCVCKDGGANCSKASMYAILGIPLILLSLLHRLF